MKELESSSGANRRVFEASHSTTGGRAFAVLRGLPACSDLGAQHGMVADTTKASAAPTGAHAAVHGGDSADSGGGDRGEYGCVQRAGEGAVETAAIREIGGVADGFP